MTTDAFQHLTDAHCHICREENSRHFLCAPCDENEIFANFSDASAAFAKTYFFAGVHPWDFAKILNRENSRENFREKLAKNSRLGVGEIGLDRLRDKMIPDAMREIFAMQLELAAEFARPVVLHGAKCWGQVVAMCRPFAKKIPSFLFHGFSRSGGLIADIAKMNGFISVGPAILNDHAVNYRALVREIPLDCLLIESDATRENVSSVAPLAKIFAKLAEIREISCDELFAKIESNATRFISPLT